MHGPHFANAIRTTMPTPRALARFLSALVLLLTAPGLAAAAPADPPTLKAAPITEAAQDADDDAALVVAEPDFRLINLPTTMRLPLFKGNFDLTHRLPAIFAAGMFIPPICSASTKARPSDSTTVWRSPGILNGGPSRVVPADASALRNTTPSINSPGVRRRSHCRCWSPAKASTTFKTNMRRRLASACRARSATSQRSTWCQPGCIIRRRPLASTVTHPTLASAAGSGSTMG